MISLILPDGELDVYKQDIAWNWTTIRFSDTLRDAYSTDFTIPKNHNNVSLLGASGLLDSPNQLFGTQIKPAVLVTGGNPVDVYIQVVSITDDDIQLCVYEKMLDDALMGKSLRDLLTDYDPTSVFEWNKNSVNDYNSAFYRYNYGSPYNSRWAQCHGSVNLRNLIQRINNRYQTNLPLNGIMSYWRVVCTGKNVCPQTTTQMVECRWDRTAESNVRSKFLIIGGQHVVNNLEGYEETTERREITFNRRCTIAFRSWISWECYPQYGTYQIYLKVNGNIRKTFNITVPAGDAACGVQEYSQDAININANDVVTIETTTGVFPLQNCAITMEWKINNYAITEEDYGNSLKYSYRPAKLPLFQYYSTQGVHEVDGLFDGAGHTINTTYNGGGATTYTFPKRSLSYFGLYCNLPDITLKDLYFSLCWLTGQKAVFENGAMRLVSPDDDLEIDGYINSISPVSSNMGQRNYIRYRGQENATPISVIDSVWLEEEHNVHQSFFVYTPNNGGYAEIDQYEIIPSEDENIGYTVTFNDVDGIACCMESSYQGVGRLVPMPAINTMGFEHITSVIEVDFETDDYRVKGLDYLHYQGRRYMIVSGDTDMQTGWSRLKMLLVPTV